MSGLSISYRICLKGNILVISDISGDIVRRIPIGLKVGGKQRKIAPPSKSSVLSRLHQKYGGVPTIQGEGQSCTKISDLPPHIIAYIMTLAASDNNLTLKSTDANWNFTQNIALNYITSYIETEDTIQHINILNAISEKYIVKVNGHVVDNLLSEIKPVMSALNEVLLGMQRIYMFSFNKQTDKTKQVFNKTIADILSTMRLAHLQNTFSGLLRSYIIQHGHVQDPQKKGNESDVEHLVNLFMEDLGYGRNQEIGTYTFSFQKIQEFLKDKDASLFLSTLDYINNKKDLTYQEKSGMLEKLYDKFQVRFGLGLDEEEFDYPDGGDY